MRRLQILATIRTISMSIALLASASAAIAAMEAQAASPVERPVERAAGAQTLDFVRTEMYFGTARSGGAVSEAEFRAFLDREITPRFPAGLTLLKGYGQFLAANGMIVSEDSYVLILLYPVQDLDSAGKRIDAIRRAYKTQFDQPAVLRVDEPTVVRVSF